MENASAVKSSLLYISGRSTKSEGRDDIPTTGDGQTTGSDSTIWTNSETPKYKSEARSKPGKSVQKCVKGSALEKQMWQTIALQYTETESVMWQSEHES